MMTKFITEVTAKFNPFSPCAKPARLFLTYLPPNARSTGMKINTILMPRTAAAPSSLKVKFSTFTTLNGSPRPRRLLWTITRKTATNEASEDGKELDFECDKTNIKGLVGECDRHSRQLQKAADLSD